jgi:hypothetical protein
MNNFKVGNIYYHKNEYVSEGFVVIIKIEDSYEDSYNVNHRFCTYYSSVERRTVPFETGSRFANQLQLIYEEK